MSEIYDYAYDHVMRRADLVHSYSTSLEDSNSEAEVNTANFSPSDLQVFVDSLETIARLEQVKRGQRQVRKVKKHRAERKKRQVTCLDASSCSSIHDDHDDDCSSFSGDSISSEYVYEETYFGADMPCQGNALYSNLNTDTNTSNSDSEDSGIFVSNNTSAIHLYENIQATNSDSDIVTVETKYKSLKSRLLAIIRKKQQVKQALTASTSIEEDTDRVRHQPSKKPKHKSSESKPEHKFLDKAMRLFTL